MVIPSAVTIKEITMATAKKRKAGSPAQPRDKSPRHRVFGMLFSKIYTCLVQKAERKNRTRKEVDQVICWLTGYTPAGLQKSIKGEGDLESFFDNSPAYNPKARLITGTVCGVRVEEVPDPLMRRIRQLDKLIDELAQGKAMEKILRQGDRDKATP
jgi:hypothetical protein